MDKIIIKNMEVYAYHGVASEERSLGQMFLISVELCLDLTDAAINDNINSTIHYGHVCDYIESIVTSHNYNLIEALAGAIADGILERYDIVQSVKVKVKKPWAPLHRHVEYVAVEMERTR